MSPKCRPRQLLYETNLPEFQARRFCTTLYCKILARKLHWVRINVLGIGIWVPSRETPTSTVGVTSLRQQPRMCTASLSYWNFTVEVRAHFQRSFRTLSRSVPRRVLEGCKRNQKMNLTMTAKLPTRFESQKSYYIRYQISCSYQVGCALQDCSVPFWVRRLSLPRERSFKSSEIDGSWKKGCLQWSISSLQSACKLKGSIRLLSHVV